MRAHYCWLWAALAVAVLLAPSPAMTHAQDKPMKWSVYSTDYYQVLYQPRHDADAKKIKGFLDAGITSLKKEFADFPVDELLKVNCLIYLHPQRTDKASEIHAGIGTGVTNGKYSAVIDMLAPAAYDPNHRTNINEPVGDDYFYKLVMHEYSTILLDRITRSKKAGWNFFSAPRWFVDGYEEYLGLMLSSPRNRKEVVAKYLAMHKEDPDRISLDFGITVKNDYIDGALLVLFMHETFGKKKVHALLMSEERSFGKAIRSVLGVGLEEFQKRWDEWLKKRLN
jgi:hypothetical protein